MSIEVQKVSTTASEFEQIRSIRYLVFVEEQNVPETDEFDQYEAQCAHFLAYHDGKPAGAARWRRTEKGFKLERFAVLKEQRGKGVGKALVAAVLKDLPAKRGELIYLHGQIPAVPFYAAFGFEKVGEPFDECAIWHYRMEKRQP